jgi:hypothetical protein
MKISLSGLLEKFGVKRVLVLRENEWASVDFWVGMHTFVYLSRSGAGEGVFGFRLKSCVLVAHFGWRLFQCSLKLIPKFDDMSRGCVFELNSISRWTR